MAEETEFKLERVETLPWKLTKTRDPVYDELYERVMQEKKGIYKVTVPFRSTKAVFSALKRRLRKRPPKKIVKLHVYNGELYIEKTDIWDIRYGLPIDEEKSTPESKIDKEPTKNLNQVKKS